MWSPICDMIDLISSEEREEMNSSSNDNGESDISSTEK